MNSKYSTGFLIASLSQLGILMTTESLGISTLGEKFTITQILIHILTGQVLGYIIFYIMKNVESIRTFNVWIIGSAAGIIAWAILLTINSSLGKVNTPWSQGVSTVLSSLIAFIVFGVISTYTIKKYDYKIEKV